MNLSIKQSPALIQHSSTLLPSSRLPLQELLKIPGGSRQNHFSLQMKTRAAQKAEATALTAGRLQRTVANVSSINLIVLLECDKLTLQVLN